MTQTELVLWHNPRCSKSRRALELLVEEGREVRVLEYLKAPPSLAQLEDLLACLNMPARNVVRTSDALYRETDFDAETADEPDWRKLLVDHPALLQRPILVAGKAAVIGRPPERVLDLL